MAEERIKAFEAKFDEMDTGKDGKMKKAEFHKLYWEIEDRECTEEESDVMFRGIDIDGNECVTKEEFMAMVKAIVNKDEVYTYKLIFRAFDKDRSNALDVKEVMAIVKYCGKECTEEQAQEAMKKATGKAKGKMDFATLYKLLTDKTIDEKNADPYDGKNKSGCCLLI